MATSFNNVFAALRTEDTALAAQQTELEPSTEHIDHNELGPGPNPHCDECDELFIGTLFLWMPKAPSKAPESPPLSPTLTEEESYIGCPEWSKYYNCDQCGTTARSSDLNTDEEPDCECQECLGTPWPQIIHEAPASTPKRGKRSRSDFESDMTPQPTTSAPPSAPTSRSRCPPVAKPGQRIFGTSRSAMSEAPKLSAVCSHTCKLSR